MTCKETEKMIPRFLNQELKGKKLFRFIEHIRECADCKEELTIQFLSSEGIQRLEEGRNFDLDRDLEAYIQMTVKKYKKQRNFRLYVLGAEILALLVIGAVFLYAWI